MSVSVSYSFSPTTTIESSQVNQNFTDVVNYINNTACKTGMITMWGGLIGSIPTGWVLCNGSSGSPDLRDRFIIGAGNTYNIGATGGATTKNLAHTHTGPSHTHSFSVTSGSISSPNLIGGTGTSQYSGDHSHAVAGNTGSSGTGNTGSGGSSSQDIMNPYLTINFIIKY